MFIVCTAFVDLTRRLRRCGRCKTACDKIRECAECGYADLRMLQRVKCDVYAEEDPHFTTFYPPSVTVGHRLAVKSADGAGTDDGTIDGVLHGRLVRGFPRLPDSQRYCKF